MQDQNLILRESDVRRRTGLSHSTIWRLRKKDRFPKPIRLSPQLIGWLVSDIDGWLAERVAEREVA
jgi:prophage regulatory protein